MRFLVTVILAFLIVSSPFQNSGQVGGFVGAGPAEAGIFRKLGAAAVAGLVMRVAAQGLTQVAKRKIVSLIEKQAVDHTFVRSVAKKIGEFRAHPKYGRYVDDVLALIDDAFPAASSRFATSKVDGAVAYAANYWNKYVRYGKMRVFQRDDLIDPGFVYKGKTNLQRMREGLAPRTKDGQTVQLHHMLQKDGQALAEVGSGFHQQHARALHINPSAMPSGIARAEFDSFRQRYWMDRALDFLR